MHLGKQLMVSRLLAVIEAFRRKDHARTTPELPEPAHR